LIFTENFGKLPTYFAVPVNFENLVILLFLILLNFAKTMPINNEHKFLFLFKFSKFETKFSKFETTNEDYINYITIIQIHQGKMEQFTFIREELIIEKDVQAE